MTPTQFRLATVTSHYSRENLRAARRILVDGDSATAVSSDTGISLSRLSQLRAEITMNLDQILREHQLEHFEIVTDQATGRRLKNNEEKELQKILKNLKDALK